METVVPNGEDTNATFRSDRPSYVKLAGFARNQLRLPLIENEEDNMPCDCTDRIELRWDWRRNVSTIGSLFSGIGGLSWVWNGLASVASRGGWRKMSTADKSSQDTGPMPLRHEDVRVVGAHNLSRVDVLCGDSCQDISGRWQNCWPHGTRSGLWSEYARLVRELRPRIVVVKTSQRLLFADSIACSVTLPRAGTMRSGFLCALPMLERRICESDCSSWPTPTVCGNYNSKGASKKSGDGLATAAKHWATPTVNGASTNNSAPPSQRKRRCKGTAVEAGANRELPLNPAWVECLMGFPEAGRPLARNTRRSASRVGTAAGCEE